MANETVHRLPLTQYLVLEVLAGRWRTGERSWTFPAAARPALRVLEALDYVGWKEGVVQRSCMAWLTEVGLAAVLSPTYEAPRPRDMV